MMEKGYDIVNNVYTPSEVEHIIGCINAIGTDRSNFRKSEDLFAIRQFLKEVPDVCPFIFNDKLKAIIQQRFGTGHFPVKSIYFDKPGASNWFVAYHQDLTISVDKKIAINGYGPWTVKHQQFSVQPPLDILQHNFTIRIHLDDTDYQNGALKVVPYSHQKGIYRPETINWENEQEDVCEVNAGGVMLMSPLLLHASNRTTNNKRRRVVHIEFSRAVLPDGLNWSEKLMLN